MTASGPLEIAWRAYKRTRDDASNAEGICATPRDFANLVEPRDRHDLFMRRNLKDRVSGRVENRMTSAQVLRAEFVQDSGAAAREVSDKLDARVAFDRLHQFVRKAFEDCECLREHRPGQLP